MKINPAKYTLTIILLLNPLMALIFEKNSIAYNVVIVLLISMVLVSVLYKKNINVLKDKITYIFAFFIFFIFLINLFYMDSIIDIIKFPLILILIYGSFVLAKNLSAGGKITVKFLIWFSIWILFVTLVFMYIDHLNGVVYYSYDYFQGTYSIVGNHSKLAEVLSPIIPIFVFEFNYIGILLGTFAIVYTMRRANLLSEIIFIFIVYFSSFIQRNIMTLKKKILFLIFTVITLLLMVFTGISEGMFERLLELESGTGSGRNIFWQLSLNNFLSYDVVELFFGHPGDLVQYLKIHFGHAIGAHSDILDMLNNYGIVGTILYFWILSELFHDFYKYRNILQKESIFGMAIIISMVFLGTVTGGVFNVLNIVTFIFLGFLTGKIQRLKGKRNAY